MKRRNTESECMLPKSPHIEVGPGSFEKEANQLQKDSKGFIDALRGLSDVSGIMVKTDPSVAMAAAQGRLADTIDVFYGSADRSSEGAMAANAYKRSVDELEASVSRELVCCDEPCTPTLIDLATGSPLQNNDTGSRGQNVRILPCYQRHNFQEKQEGVSIS